jgi:uncharacterized SAM-binding protein YcdF (DUF218 family)
MKEYLAGKGITPRKIIEEDKSSNTFENILYSGRIIKKISAKFPTLITYDLHMRRSLATATMLNLSCSWLSAKTDKVMVGKRKWWQINRLSIIIYEIFALVLSKFMGWA